MDPFPQSSSKIDHPQMTQRVYRPDTVPAFARNHPFIPFMVGVGLVGVFVAFPEIDLWVQHLAWSPETGFAPKRTGFWGTLYTSVPVAAWGVTVGALVLLCWGELRRRYAFGIDRKAVVYLLTTLITGPGLIVNSLFKDNWGRARPSQITEFGGSADFTPAFVRASECISNCSFVSGHAAMGFYMVAIAFLFTGKTRRVMIGLALVYGVFVGAGRIAQGGHFLSDVLFSGLFTVTTAAVCFHYLLHKDALGRVPFLTPRWRKPV